MSQNSDEYDFLFKVVLAGESGVGKSNLFSRFTRGTFTPTTRSTIGVEFGTRTLHLSNSSVKAQIWDTAGNERYRAITSAYYRGACGVVLVYDVTQRQSFVRLGKWLKEAREFMEREPVMMMVGNKADREEEREVERDEAAMFAADENLYCIEASALDGSNVDIAFKRMLEAP